MSENGAKASHVSVIIPCYCCANTIVRAVDSVASQTLLPAQLILVDDGSPDAGATLAEMHRLQARYSSRFAIEIIALPENVGAAEARNAGWERVSQPFIAFLDADDAWHPKKLEIQCAYLDSHPDVILCGHGHRWERCGVIPDWKVNSLVVKEIGKGAMLMSNRFVTPSVMIKTDVPFRFMAGHRHMEDHLLWLQIVCEGMKVAKLDADLVAIYKHPFGDSGLSADLWQMTRADLGNYWILHSHAKLGTVMTVTLTLFSLLKLLRRIVLVSLRHITGNTGGREPGGLR